MQSWQRQCLLCRTFDPRTHTLIWASSLATVKNDQTCRECVSMSGMGQNISDTLTNQLEFTMPLPENCSLVHSVNTWQIQNCKLRTLRN
jgi:hypothetical protein